VTVTGLEAWETNLFSMRAALPHFVDAANREASDIVQQETIRRMERQFKLPRDQRTGALSRSVFIAPQGDLTHGNDGKITLTGTVGEGINYAGWWEYGYEKDVHPPPFRLYAPRGRTIYPSIRRKWPEIRALYVAVANRLGKMSERGLL
jgi:hypothetical protein